MTAVSILLVEDNHGDALLMKVALKKAAIVCDLHVAKNASIGLDMLYQRNGQEQVAPIDIALFDINLPGMNGVELLHEVKSDPAKADIPIVMLTSSDAPQDLKNAFEGRADAYINKPINVEELRCVMQKFSCITLHA